MALAYSNAVNAARLDQIESTIGVSAKLLIYTGAAPAVTAAATGTLLATIALPSDWMAAAAVTSPATKAKTGTWQGTASAAGTAGYFRITATDGVTTGIQGTCGQGSGDMSFDNSVLANGQTITINSFTLTSANI